MSRPDEMAAFVRILDKGGFAPAARDLGLTPSALSKLVGRMEARLGVRLLARTTRRLSPTPEGEAYGARARDILALIEAAGDLRRAGTLVHGSPGWASSGRLAWRANPRSLRGARHAVQGQCRPPP
jgi:DNA-binding transcriptional LysR family regulator